MAMQQNREQEFVHFYQKKLKKKLFKIMYSAFKSSINERVAQIAKKMDLAAKYYDKRLKR